METNKSLIGQNPNAEMSALAAYGAVMLAYGVGALGIELPNEVAAACTGFVITVALLLGKKRREARSY